MCGWTAKGQRGGRESGNRENFSAAARRCPPAISACFSSRPSHQTRFDKRTHTPSLRLLKGRSLLVIIQCNWLCYSRLFGDCLFFFGRKSRKRSSPSSPTEVSALTEATPPVTRMSQPTPLLVHEPQKAERRGSQPLTLTSLGESLRESLLSRRATDITSKTSSPARKAVQQPSPSFERVSIKKTIQTEGQVGKSERNDKSAKRANVPGSGLQPMDTEEWRTRGQEMVEYIASYSDTIAKRRVTPSVEPGYLKPLLPDAAPYKPESWDQIMDDFEQYIMPGVTHWQHPRFHAYFPAGNAYPSILADMLSDAIGCIGFSWVRIKVAIYSFSMVTKWIFYRRPVLRVQSWR